MQGIEVYLKKFEQFGFKERELIKKIAQVIFDVCGVEVSEKEIKIQEGVVRIAISGAGKSEIFLKRKEIEAKCNEITTLL